MEVLVGLVELEHRELGVVARGDAFVPEVAVDLEDFLQAAHGEALQVQLRRDAQEELHVERVVVRLERPCRGSARNRMHHRRLDLEVAALHEELADRLHELRADLEGPARLGRDDEVHVALPVALLHVREPVELLGQRAQRLREQADLRRVDRELALHRPEDGALDAQDVAQVPVLERLVGLDAGDVVVHVDLDLAAHVLERRERGLAHDALQHHAAGHGGLRLLALELGLVLAAMEVVQLGGEVLAAEIVGIGVAGLAQLRELRSPLGEDLVLVLQGGSGGFSFFSFAMSADLFLRDVHDEPHGEVQPRLDAGNEDVFVVGAVGAETPWQAESFDHRVLRLGAQRRPHRCRRLQPSRRRRASCRSRDRSPARGARPRSKRAWPAGGAATALEAHLHHGIGHERMGDLLPHFLLDAVVVLDAVHAHVGDRLRRFGNHVVRAAAGLGVGPVQLQARGGIGEILCLEDPGATVPPARSLPRSGEEPA